MVSFELRGGAAETRAFVDRLRVPTIASNFGSSRSLVEHCASFTYYKECAAERRELGITDGLVRLSVGYEPDDAILADIAASLNACEPSAVH